MIKKQDKRWSVWVLIFVLIGLIAFGAIIVLVDPFFHYHAPIKGITQVLERDNERYQNDGILAHFSYDTIITGTSLTENFKTSECDLIFGGTSAKVPLAGGTYKEMNEQLERAFLSENEITTVIRCLDRECLDYDKDRMMENFAFPTYITNDNLFDDVSYVFNKAVMKQVVRNLAYTIKGYPSTSFDEYANWMQYTKYGKEQVLSTYSLDEKATTEREFTEEDRIRTKDNVRQNVTELIETHPETTFYLFFPPYSICYWDKIVNNGELSYWLEAEKLAVEELLKYPNIKLYSFANDYEVVCDLDNYCDTVHYGEWINTQMMECMKDGKYMLTQDNYKDYFEDMEKFYSSYDYSKLH